MNTKTLMYILKRIGLALLTVWIVITVTFFVMHAVPGGPFAAEKAISAEAEAALKAKYGLDKPVFDQYITYQEGIIVRRTQFDLDRAQREMHIFEGSLEGVIAQEKSGNGGFGYDPIFIADEFPGLTLADISEEEKNAISHRGKALRAMAQWLHENS